MFKRVISKSSPIYIFIAILVILSFSLSIASGQVDSVPEIQQKLSAISEEERQILQDLFILLQEIEAIEFEEEEISNEIEIINKEIDSLEKKISDGTIIYDNMKEDLKQVLRSYQRMGAGSYLKIILESDGLTNLIRRINIIRDVTNNTGKLLENLDESKEELEIEKSKLTEKILSLEEKQNQLSESMKRKLQAKNNMEEYLASMDEERWYYEEYLNNIQLVWNELKVTFANAVNELNQMIEKGDLPPDAMKVSLTISGIKGSIDEITFNEIIAEHTSFSNIDFNFSPEKIKMMLSEENLTLIGTFTIVDGNKLKFEVNEGEFYGMALEFSSIDELFRQGHIVFDLKPMIGSTVIRSIKILDGYIELLAIPSLSNS